MPLYQISLLQISPTVLLVVSYAMENQLMTSRTLIRTHIPCLKLDTYTVQSIYVLCEGTSYIIQCTCLPE